MDLTASSFFVSLLVGSVGFVAASYGKSQKRLPQLVTGIVLVVFPYFVDSALATIVIAALLLALMTAAIRLGY